MFGHYWNNSSHRSGLFRNNDRLGGHHPVNNQLCGANSNSMFMSERITPFPL